ncbi:efflux RND transporter periplasmic adaptor subunit [Pseudomonas sp. 7SR1]|uniref:efflux RND transporter periplasmic adaptor subunit n=1 Tax=Pseudomonas sp. 7SR1 TaxID=1881017 RepID=UPI0009538018|nr:efflux RND transporter periplasmic adaptor subunit [Pseudomonas sp. 7SR1]SIR89973.1 RND family efflux transporter, MFP subunit [Pseudomonas sp. 7SR1]
MSQDQEHRSPSTQGHLRKHPVAYFVGVIALAVAALAIIVVKRSPAPAEDSAVATPALTVTSAAPREVSWPTEIRASGAIAAWEEASIGAQIGGYQLTDVRVNVGDVVKKGQVIARFDPALLQADHAQLKANADQAAANRQRALTLQSSGAMSDQDVLQLVTQSKTADALLAANELRLRYTDVKAPDDGVISARTATLGTVVPVGQELFRMIRRGRLEWRGELTAEQLAQVKVGQEVALDLPDGKTAKGTVRQTSPILDSASRLAIVYADIPPGSTARAGMYANGRLGLGTGPALVVPAESVVIRDGHSHVLVLADTSATPRVSLRSVTVGRRIGREVEITKGLAQGEHVVVQGAGFLKDRDLVRISQGQPAGAARP